MKKKSLLCTGPGALRALWEHREVIRERERAGPVEPGVLLLLGLRVFQARSFLVNLTQRSRDWKTQEENQIAQKASYKVNQDL